MFRLFVQQQPNAVLLPDETTRISHAINSKVKWISGFGRKPFRDRKEVMEQQSEHQLLLAPVQIQTARWKAATNLCHM